MYCGHPDNALVARLMGHTNIFTATIEAHDKAQGITRINWRGLSLELALNEAFEVGTAIDWVIHPAHMIMHRRDRPSLGERENPVHGVVKALLELGETAVVSLALEGKDSVYLRF